MSNIKFNLDVMIEDAVEVMVDNSIDNNYIDKCRDMDDLHDIIVVGAGYERYLADDDDYKRFCDKLEYINIDKLNETVMETIENGFSDLNKPFKFTI